jgi:hypothetical protein
MSARRLLASLALFVAACVGDPTEGEPESREGPGSVGDGGAGDLGEPCPEEQPKVGDDCPRELLVTTICQYKIDECTSPSGLVYPEYIYFCCREISGQPKAWALCAGDNACYAFDAAAPQPPPAVDAPVDRPVSLPDAGAPSDAAPDAAPDVASDASAD